LRLRDLQVRLAANRYIVRQPARRAQGLHAFLLKSCEVGFSGTHRIHHAAQQSRQQQGFFPLRRREVSIAAAQRQARLVALGFAADHVNGQRKLFDHAANNHELLVILLAK
jgi:hypothetical protein